MSLLGNYIKLRFEYFFHGLAILTEPLITFTIKDCSLQQLGLRGAQHTQSRIFSERPEYFWPIYMSKF